MDEPTYLTAYHVARHGRAEGDGDTTHVAVPVDEYAALIRARDILDNPEQLADVIAAVALNHRTGHIPIWSDYVAAIGDCLRRAAADVVSGGQPDPTR